MKLSTRTSLITLMTVLSLSAVSPALASQDTDGDGVPDTAEPLLHTDPMNPDTDGDGVNDLADQSPVFADAPSFSGTAPAPFEITSAQVEDNYDPVARRDAPDHLELEVSNSGATDLSGFTVYYTITDNDTGDSEAYLVALDGFVVPAGGSNRIYFDDAILEGHFRANPNSIYTSSLNAKTFSVTVAAEGFQPVSIEIHKDAGGAETAD